MSLIVVTKNVFKIKTHRFSLTLHKISLYYTVHTHVCTQMASINYEFAASNRETSDQ